MGVTSANIPGSDGDNTDSTGIRGGTDNTIIGNVSDAMKVSAAQSGSWTTDRTWSLLNSTDSVNAVQSGNWSILNISGAISLPTGAATSANQTTIITSLQLMDNVIGPVGAGSPATNSALIGGMYNTTPVAPTNGQQVALQVDSDGSLLVATADTAFATQNITTVDSATSSASGANSQTIYSGTPTANSAASFALNAEQAITVQVSGTWTGTLQAEISLDSGTTWFSRPIHQTGTSFTSATFTANFTGGANSAGYTNFRIRATAAMTGTATVKLIASDTINTVYVGNGVKLIGATDSTLIGNVSDSIKANVSGITLSAGQVPTFSSKLKADITTTVVNITSSVTYATIYTYSGTGLLVGFSNEFNSTAIVVKLVIDGDTVFDGVDIGTLNGFLFTANTVDRRQNGQGITSLSSAIDFSMRQPIRFATSVVISARLTSGAVAKTFNQGVVYIQKDT